jgi:hypothetical protein
VIDGDGRIAEAAARDGSDRFVTASVFGVRGREGSAGRNTDERGRGAGGRLLPSRPP